MKRWLFSAALFAKCLLMRALERQMSSHLVVVCRSRRYLISCYRFRVCAYETLDALATYLLPNHAMKSTL